MHNISDYQLVQTPEGTWLVRSAEGAEQIDNITGWDDIATLAQRHTVHWPAPSDLSRFRSQFGEPPDDLPEGAVTVGE